MPRPRLTKEEYELWLKVQELGFERVSELISEEDIEWNHEEGKVTSISQRIKTLDDLIESADVDLDVYDIERQKVNAWEVTSWKRGFPEVRTNHQVTAWLKNRYFEKIDGKTVSEIIGKHADLLPKVTRRKDVTGKPLVCAIADLHCGAYTENMKLVPDYNIEALKNKLYKLSELLNSLRMPTHLKIAGDLIESFTGKNHKDTWRQIEQHGMKVMFTVADLLIWFINRTDCIIDVEIISGNHDRISSANDDDHEGQVAYGVAELLRRSGLKVKFDPLVISSEHDGVNYIILHGHLPISKKNPAELVLDYGVQDMFNVIIQAHKHNQQIPKSTTKMMVHQIPSLVPANEFAERLGAHAPTGVVLYEANGLGSVDFKSVAI